MSELDLKLRLSVVKTGLENITAIIGELKNAGVETGKFEDEAKQLGDELNKLGREQGLIDAFKKLKTETQAAEKAMADAKTKASELGKELKDTESPTKKQQAAFEKARKAARDAAEAYQTNAVGLQQLRGKMQEAGVSTSGLAAHQLRLRKTQEGLVASGQSLTQSLQASSEAAKQSAAANAKQSADMELLGLRAHNKIQQEIDETRAAYDRLASSGKLSSAELANAALKTEDRVRELKKQTGDWANSLGNAKTALAGLAASGAGLVAVAAQAIQFESAMADVAKVVDGTEEQIGALSSRIKELSTEIPLSADALAQIAAAGGQLGVPIEKLETFIQLAAQMSVAFGLSADEAGQAVAKLSNIFGLPIEQVEKLGDAINTLGNTTAAKEADIVGVLTRIGGTAKQFGLSAEQAAALGTAMLSLGVKSEVAGTGINALLSKLQTANVQGPEFQAALAGIGLSAEQLANDIRDKPQQALIDFLRTLAQLDKQSRAETLTRLFGQEYQDDIARLLGGLDQYETALTRVGDSAQTAGAMQKEFETRVKTTEAQIQLLKNGVETIAINLGSVFLPALREMVGALGDAAGAVAKFVETFPAIAGVAGAIGTAAASAGALKLAFLALRVAGVGSFAAISAEVVALNKTLPALAAQAGKTAAIMKAAGLSAAAGWIGWNVGTYLREEFLVVEQAGIALAAGMTKLAERARFALEVLNTPVDGNTLDNINAAYDRMQLNLAAIDDEYAALFESAGKAKDKQVEAGNAGEQAGEKAKAGAAKAATAAEQLAAALGLAGEEGKKAGADIEASLNGINITSLDGVLALSDAFLIAGGKAGEMEKTVTGMIAKITQADLSAFAASLGQAFKSGQIESQEFARINDAVLAESFKRLGLSAEKELGRISPAAKDAITQLDNIRITLANTAATGEQKMAALAASISASLGKADTVAAVEAIKKRIEEMGKSGELSAAQLTQFANAVQSRLAELPVGINNTTEAFKTLGVTSQAALQRMAEQARLAYDAIRQSGTASAKDQEAAFLAYAQAVIAANGGVASETIKAQASALGLTDALQQMERAAQPLSAAMQALGANYDKTARAAELEANRVNQANQSTIQAAKNALELAKAKGDENEIRRASLALAEAEVKQAEAVALAKMQELVAAQQHVQAIEQEALADGVLTAAEQAVIDKSQQVADAKREEASAAAAAADAERTESSATQESITQMGGFISITHIVRNRYAEMSEAALALFDAQMKNVHSFKTWFDVISDDRYNKVKAQFDAMASEVDQMTERLDAGAVSSYELAHAAQAAAHYGELLGEEQLGPLRRALDDARSRMKSLRDEAQNTLADLQDELLQLQGNEDEVARRRLERRKAEIEAQLAEAQGGGDRETVARLQEALQTLDKIGKEEAKQRAARASEERTATRPTTSTPAQPATSNTPAQRVRIDLVSGNDSATVYADSERDLVTLLSRAKLRST